MIELQRDWLELTSTESAQISREIEAEGQPDSCHICFATPWVSRACESFEVRQCLKCDEYVCQDHAEVGMDHDQDGFYVSAWFCKSGCEEVSG